MRVHGIALATVLAGAACAGPGSNRSSSAAIAARVPISHAASEARLADSVELQARRQRAFQAFPDGILLVRASSARDLSSDSFKQDAAFHYFTGIESHLGAVLAIDGRLHESWLFHDQESDEVNEAGLEHSVDWAQLESFLASRSGPGAKAYYQSGGDPDLPSNLASPGIPAWLRVLQARYPAFAFEDVGRRVSALMAVQSAAELAAVRSAARASVDAWLAGMRAVAPGVSQRSVELAVVGGCWDAGAHGPSFWPWAMAGAAGVFPNPFQSISRYDHLDQTMRAGDLVRLDVGCEWQHYGGDVGRTIPVAGRFTDEQRETWNIFVDAYRAGASALRDGTTVEQVWGLWKQALVGHRSAARTSLAKRAIDLWSQPENVKFWQVHTMNLEAGAAPVPLRAGTTVDFEPIASIDGQGYYLEDMYLITQTGFELLTPGLPTTAEQIESAMNGIDANDAALK